MTAPTPRLERKQSERKMLRLLGVAVFVALLAFAYISIKTGQAKEQQRLDDWNRANLAMLQAVQGDCASLDRAAHIYDQALQDLQLFNNPIPRRRVVFRASLTTRLQPLCGTDLDEQIAAAGQTAASADNDPTALVDLAILQLAAGDLDAAQSSAIKALSRDPEHNAAREMAKTLDDLTRLPH